MDEENFSLSLNLLTENIKMIQSDVVKIQNDVGILKSDGVSVSGGAGADGVDGRTPTFASNVTVNAGGVVPTTASAQINSTGTNSNGDPVYTLSLGIPSGVPGDDGRTPIFASNVIVNAGGVPTTGSAQITGPVLDTNGDPVYTLYLGIPGNAPVYFEASLQAGKIISISNPSGIADDTRTPGIYFVNGTVLTGNGSDQRFQVDVNAGGDATVSILNAGANFATGDTINISSTDLGTGTNDISFNINEVTNLKIQCASDPGFVDLTSWHVSNSSNLVSNSTLFAGGRTVFKAPRTGSYLVHMRTQLIEKSNVDERAIQLTQRLYKSDPLPANSVYNDIVHPSITSATYSYDFRKASDHNPDLLENSVYDSSVDASIPDATWSFDFRKANDHNNEDLLANSVYDQNVDPLIPTATASFDFRRANTHTGDSTQQTIFFQNQTGTQSSNGIATLVRDDINVPWPDYDTTDGYFGSLDHYINYDANQIALWNGSNNNFSLEFYVKMQESNVTAYQTVFFAGLDPTSSLPANGTLFLLQYYGGIYQDTQLWALNSSGSYSEVMSSSNLLNTTSFVHIVLVYNGTSIKTYKDGVLFNTSNFTLTAEVPLNVRTGRTHYFENEVSNPEILRFFRYYDGALTAEQVSTLHFVHTTYKKISDFISFATPQPNQEQASPSNSVAVGRDPLANVSFPTYSDTEGYPGTANHYLIFDNNKISLTNGNNTQYFSLEFYLKIDAGGTGRQTVFYAENAGQQLIDLFYNQSGSTELWAYGPEWLRLFSQTLFTSTFVHVVFVYNGSSITVFKDGFNVGTFNFVLSPQKPTHVTMGRRVGLGGAFADHGPESLRFFRYYDFDLTPEQVTTLYFVHTENKLERQFISFATPQPNQEQASNENSVQVVRDDVSVSFPNYNSTNGYPGTTGHYLNFDTNHIDISGGSNPFALEFYVKMGASTGTSTLFDAAHSDAGPIFTIKFDSLGKTAIDVSTTAGFEGPLYEEANLLSTTEFVHLVIVYNGTMLTTYKNGSQYRPVSNIVVQDTEAPNSVLIGRAIDGGDDDGPEDLRFFRYYNTALTAAQVATLYNAHVFNDARTYLTTYSATKAALYGSVDRTASQQGFQDDNDASFQFYKLVHMEINDVLAIEQKTSNKGNNLSDANDALEFRPDDTLLIVRSVD